MGLIEFTKESLDDYLVIVTKKLFSEIRFDIPENASKEEHQIELKVTNGSQFCFGTDMIFIHAGAK